MIRARLRPRLLVSALALASLAAVLAPAPPAFAFGPFPVPNGYRQVSRSWLTQNVVYMVYKSSNPLRVLNIVFVRHGASEHFRAVLSNERVAGPSPTTETVSSMCRRVKCIVATNGDFFSNTTGQPAGGMAYDGIPVRTPPSDRYHFVQDWAGNVIVMHPSLNISFSVPYPNGNKPVYVHHLNTPRDYNRAIVYTPLWGPSTQTDSTGYELVATVNNPPIKMGKALSLTITKGVKGGNTSIPSNGVVISGNGGYVSTLSQIWADIQAGKAQASANLELDSSPNLRTYVGGVPALVLGGKQGYTSDGSSRYTVRNPRTMVGRNGNGDAIIVQVDGRQSSWSVGFTMYEAYQFMKAMGANYALNLDDGGSSEFVKYNAVMDRPSDGRERPVAAALALVP